MKEYMPKKLTEEKMCSIIDQLNKSIGQAMVNFSKNFKVKVDNNILSNTVDKYLGDHK